MAPRPSLVGGPSDSTRSHELLRERARMLEFPGIANRSFEASARAGIGRLVVWPDEAAGILPDCNVYVPAGTCTCW